MCSWKECGGKLWWRIEVRHEMIENRHRKKRDEVIENRHEVAKDQIQISWDIPSGRPEEQSPRVRCNQKQNTRVYHRKRRRTTWGHLKTCKTRISEKGNTVNTEERGWKAHQLKSIICLSNTSFATISGRAILVRHTETEQSSAPRAASIRAAAPTEVRRHRSSCCVYVSKLVKYKLW